MGVRGRNLALAIAAGMSLSAVAGDARAGTTCAYDADSGTVRVALGGGSATLERGAGSPGADPLTLDGVRCGSATVANTDSIVIPDRGKRLIVSLAGGPLAPGRTDEPGDSDEIEIVLDQPAGANVTIEGGDGPDDIVLGRDGANLNAGEDTGIDADVVTQLVSVSARGGDGDDRLDAGGGEGTGEPRSYGELDGGDGADVLIGGDGEDELHGGDGDDTLAGGAGSDRLFGEVGADTLDAGDRGWQLDQLLGGPGPDHLIGRSGSSPGGALADYEGDGDVVADLATGQVSADGHGSSDTLEGITAIRTFNGDDRIAGTDGSDLIDAGDGEDEITSGGGADVVDTGSGADDIDLGPGDDELTAYGAGATVRAGGGDDELQLRELAAEVDGGQGRDQLFQGSGSAIVADLLRGTIGPADEPDAGSIASMEEVLIGSSHDDLLLGGTAAETLGARGGGDDRVRGGPGDDTITNGIADYSTSLVPISAHGDQVQSADGTDTVETRLVTVRGTRYADDIDGFPQVQGGPGDDRITGGGPVADRLDGGPGDDVITGEGWAELIGGPGDDRLDGSGGTATADYGAAAAGVVANLAAGVAQDGDGGEDVLIGVVNLSGSPRADRLTGTDGDNRIDGRAGDDAIAAGDGNDEVYMSPGDDDLDAGAGTYDTVLIDGNSVSPVIDFAAPRSRDGWGGTDHVSGFENARSFAALPAEMSGDDGPNNLFGGPYDTARGRGGDDELRAGRMLGGPGNDHLNSETGSFGMFAFDYSEAASGVIATVPWFGVSPTQATDGDGGIDTLRGAGAVIGSPFADRITGDDHVDDVIEGGGGDDEIAGLAGDDRLTGGAGSDVLDGGDGSDELFARDGEDDRGTCGTGDDVLTADASPLDGLGECEQRIDRAEPEPTPAGSAGTAAEPAGTPVGPTAPAASEVAAQSRDAGRPFTVRGTARRTSLPSLVRRGISVRVTCSLACSLRAELVPQRATRLRAGLNRRPIAVRTTRLAGTASVRLKLTRTAARRLARLRTARVDLVLVGRAAGRAPARHRVTLRLSR